LTDYEQTPMHRVYEMVKREAERYGAMPVGSEIVGWSRRKPSRWLQIISCSLRTFLRRKCLKNKLEAALSGTPLQAPQEGNRLNWRIRSGCSG